jgi:uncharacterized protein YndB with AHSA1/START domain
MQTETQPTQTDRIEKKILLRAPRGRVWRAISDSNEFGTWFGMKVDGPFSAGATVHATIVPTQVDADVAAKQKPYEGMPCELMIERIEPEQLFSFRWHPFPVGDADHSDELMTLVSFELAEAADGVMLTITESGFDRIPLERRAKAFAGNDEGWTLQTKLIEKYLAKAS